MASVRASALTRLLIGVAIVGFWLAMMYSLLKDRILPRARATETVEVDLSRLGDTWQNIDDYYRIANEGLTIGGARWIIYATTRPIGYRVDLNSELLLKIFNKQLTIQLEIGTQLDYNFQLTDFDAYLDILKTSIRVRGMVMPDNRLLVRVSLFVDEQPGRVDHYVVALERPLSMIDVMRPLALRGADLAVGKAYETEVLDPVWQMTRGTMSIQVEAEETITIGGTDHQAMRLRNEFAGTTTYSWVDLTGRLLRRQIMPNRPLFMELSSAEALKKYATTLDALTPIEAMDPSEFDGVEVTPLSTIDFSGIFDALSIIPEYDPR